MLADTKTVTRRFVRVGVLALASVVVSVSFVVGSGARVASQRVPLIDDTPNLQNSRSDPQEVRDRTERFAREALQELRRISGKEPSLEAGCRSTGFPGSLGPPAPVSVTPRIIGHHVEAIVRFAKLPKSPVCRPWAIRITMFGKPITAGGRFPWSQYYQLVGPVGRAVIQLPMYSTAPYELWVQSGTIQNRTSKTIKIKLRCPAAGCLAGDAPTQHDSGKTAPRFPLRRVSAAQLQESFSAGEDAIARSALFMRFRTSCSGTTSCLVTYTDPLFPDHPYRVRYTIAGEQQAGCWYVSHFQKLDEPPFDDAFARSPVAGCVSWLN